MWFERILWAAGTSALGYCAFLIGLAIYDQEQGNRSLELYTNAAAPRNDSHPNQPEGSLVGRLEIPRLRLRAVVFEGTSDGTLARGVGRLRGSAVPGQLGNLVLAGHRDTFFRPLRKIREGDLIQVTTPAGPINYEVESLAVVAPDAVQELQARGGYTLTLITCFPFGYVGSAPDRFVVRAREIAGNEGRPLL